MKKGKRQITSISTKTDVAFVEEYKKKKRICSQKMFYSLIILIKLLSHICFEARGVELLNRVTFKEVNNNINVMIMT